MARLAGGVAGGTGRRSPVGGGLLPIVAPGLLSGATAAVLSAAAGDGSGVLVTLLAVAAVAAVALARSRRWARAAGSAPVDRHADLVPGAMVHLVTGDVVPAWLRCTRTAGLQVEGWSQLHHDAGDAASTEPAAASGRVVAGDLLPPGAVVVRGAGDFEVAPPRPAARRAPSGWDRDLALLAGPGTLLLAVVAVAAGVLAAVNGGDAGVVLSCAAAVLATGPATALIAVAVAAGRHAAARRLSRVGVSLRSRAAFERAGVVTLLVTDTAGAATEGAASLVHMWAPDGDVEGLARALILSGADDEAFAEPAMTRWAESLGLDPDAIRVGAPRVAEVPFDASRRLTTTVSETGDGFLVVCRGAPESVWQSLVTAGDGASSAAAVAVPLAGAWAAEGLRVIAVATSTRRVVGNATGRLEWGLRLRGLVALLEPLAAGTRDAVEDLAELGVDTALASSEHRATATAAAAKVGVLHGTRGAGVVSGEDLDSGGWAGDVRVFARVGPDQRVRLVERWQATGEVVAATGHDLGVVAALRAADLGIALGGQPPPGLRHVAGVVVRTADLRSVVQLVRESRQARDWLRRFAGVLLVAVAVVATVVGVSAALGRAPGLSASQAVWVTLLAAALPAAAFGREPLRVAAAARSPRGAGDHLLPPRWWGRVVVVAMALALAVLALVLLGAAVFPAAAAAALGAAAGNRAGPVDGPAGRGRVTARLLGAGVALAALAALPAWLPRLSVLGGGDGIAGPDVLAAVLAAIAGYAATAVIRTR